MTRLIYSNTLNKDFHFLILIYCPSRSLKYFELSQSLGGMKTEIQVKNNLKTFKQNMTRLTCALREASTHSGEMTKQINALTHCLLGNFSCFFVVC